MTDSKNVFGVSKIMVREIAERPKRALIRRESTFRNTRKTPKFQRINGWDTTPVVSDSLDIVAWSNLQGLLHAKKDSKKLKLTEEDLQYKHVPKSRCTHLDDEQVFEKHSLHRSLLLREKEELSKPKRAKTSLNIAPSSTPGTISSTPIASVPKVPPPVPTPSVTTTKPFTFRTAQLIESRRQGEINKKRLDALLRSKTQDDMRIFLRSDEESQRRLLQTCFPSKRSRSVPITQSVDLSDIQTPYTNPASYRRMLFYARRYGSRDDITHMEEDEEVEVEDEGYGSKTPSNDEKDIATLFNDALNLEGSSLSVRNSAPKSKSKVAKFSYTHQLAKSQLYEESEDEKSSGLFDDSNSPIKYYKTGYVDNKGNEFVKRMLHRAYTSIGSDFGSTGMYRLDGVKPPVTMRKISIQDSGGECGSYAKRNSTPTPDKKDMYEPQRTIVRQNSIVQSDRTQYPMSCNTPELRFNTNTTPPERPSSKASNRGAKPDSAKRSGARGTTPGKSSQKPNNELLRRTKSNCLELYRAHTSVCVPIADLLPAVDKSIREKSKTKVRPGVHVSESVPELPTSVLTPRMTEDHVTTSVEYTLLPSSKNSTPRKAHSESTTPEYAQRKPYSVLTSLSPSLSHQASPRETRSKLTSTKTTDKQGSQTSVRLNVLGLDIVVPCVTSRSASLTRQRKVRYTSNPDKDTKKKLRDAFSRFYNKQPYGTGTDRRAWSEELKFVWNG